jgi:hypothetical protein
MRKIAGTGLRQKSPPLHDVMSNKRDQHRVFNVGIKSVTVADAVEGKSGG